MIARIGTLGLVAFALAGCARQADSDYGRIWQLLRASVRNSFGEQKVTRAEAAAIPYASMGWRLGKSAEMLIVLATDTDGQRLWTSAAHIVLVTRDGRLQRSVGLPHDLSGMIPAAGASLSPPALALQQPFRSSRLMDFPDLGRYGVKVDCDTRQAGREGIKILGQSIATVRISEVCYCATLRWHFTDQYWVDPDDGAVWRAIQHIHPKEDALETEVLRPPS